MSSPAAGGSLAAMLLRRVNLLSYRSVDFLDFEVGSFTVLFGKNNAGKTNILEAIYGVLAPTELPGHLAGDTVARGLRGAGDLLPPLGAVDVKLDPGELFDDEILALASGGQADVVTEDGVVLDLERRAAEEVAFISYYDTTGICSCDPHPFFEYLSRNAFDFEAGESFQSALTDGPRPRPLFVDWEFQDIDERVTDALIEVLSGGPPGQLTTKPRRKSREKPWIRHSPVWLEVSDSAESGTYQVRAEIDRVVRLFASLATDFLPDFIDGSVSAQFSVPTFWGTSPSVAVRFEERGEDTTSSVVEDVGRGAARWIAAAAQIALHVLKHGNDLLKYEGEYEEALSFSGHVLFIDEPEAHLHPSAVASIVRWCQKMVMLGFNVVVGSHHEEFLRASGGGQTLVHVMRDTVSGCTHATTLPSARTTRLLELAADVGMHPASALSIQRAILYVEGPLDEAVLDEYASLELDSAGVKIIPIRGTKNLEGLVAVELLADLGIKTGILTDATDPATMLERAKSKRSAEEKKVIDVIRIADEKGLPTPTIFGVPEDDLLFALPADAIRDHLGGPFPGWKELVAECRQALGKTPSDSVDWKSYAAEHYGLQINTPGGVRELVRALDLANVPLPSIRTVVDQIIAWAQSTG